MTIVTLMDFIDWFIKLPAFPYFDVPHYILMNVLIREDMERYGVIKEDLSYVQIDDYPDFENADRIVDFHHHPGFHHHKPYDFKSGGSPDGGVDDEAFGGTDQQITLNNAGLVRFPRRHGFAAWSYTILMCFAGRFISQALLSDPIIKPLTLQVEILAATLVWYLMTYSPFDILHKLCKCLPMRALLYSLKQIQVTQRVDLGVKIALAKYPDCYILSCVVGVIRGAGYHFSLPFVRLLRGIWVPQHNEFLYPSVATRSCFSSAVIFILEHNSLLPLPDRIIYLGILVKMLVYNVSASVFNTSDPTEVTHEHFKFVAFGGLSRYIEDYIRTFLNSDEYGDNEPTHDERLHYGTQHGLAEEEEKAEHQRDMERNRQRGRQRGRQRKRHRSHPQR